MVEKSNSPMQIEPVQRFESGEGGQWQRGKGVIAEVEGLERTRQRPEKSNT